MSKSTADLEIKSNALQEVEVKESLDAKVPSTKKLEEEIEALDELIDQMDGILEEYSHVSGRRISTKEKMAIIFPPSDRARLGLEGLDDMLDKDAETPVVGEESSGE
jgi:hypothetical protein